MALKEVNDSAKKIKNVFQRINVQASVQIICWLALAVTVLARWGNASKNDQIDYVKEQLQEKIRECERKDSQYHADIAGKDLELKAEREGKAKQVHEIDSIQNSRIEELKNKLK